MLPPASGPWLAMSGGGADGAFAAGLLNGWTQSGKRPEFSVVTGVSIGALLAPYAFLGSKFDEELRQAIASITGADIFEDRPTHESFLDTWPLRRLLEKRVTPELVAGVAAEHRKGRRLLVVTTNADSGRRVVWDMGAIAQKGDEAVGQAVPRRAAGIVRDPRLLHAGADRRRSERQEIPGDAHRRLRHRAVLRRARGGARARQQAAPARDGALHRPQRPAGARFLSAGADDGRDPEPADQRRAAGGLRAESMLFAANAQRLGVPMYIAQVADSFNHPSYGLFDEKYMNALYEHGVERAKNGTAFESDRAARARAAHRQILDPETPATDQAVVFSAR